MAPKRSEALGLCTRTFWAATLGHELVKFRLVLGMAQAIEERHEFALLFFETAQGFGAVFVKGAIAARTPLGPAAPPLGSRLHAVHPALPAFHAPLPAV